ncbi:MAG: hypothetical protein J6N45_09740 [Alphaproteobacteria bacterium]|nr:hypothetical protein [Alphaproteobacteria bacterium]
MAENTEEQSWWQWIGNTAAGLYTAKLGAKVQIAQEKNALEQAQNNQTLSFLGYNLHKTTLLWIGGGVLVTALLIAVLKR